MKKIGALQTAYLPWLGFFDRIRQCDLFVIYDDLQYTKKDWRNRNRIKTSQGAIWLTVPVVEHNALQKRICDIEIALDEQWAKQHRRTIEMNYAGTPCFAQYSSFFKDLYRQKWRYLAQLKREILDFCLYRLGIDTEVIYSLESGIEADYLSGCMGRTDPTERIIFLCRRFGATHFLEGSKGRDYVRRDLLEHEGIFLEYHDYTHPVYEQRFGEFIPYLSIVDLLFNHGDKSTAILAGEKKNPPQTEKP